MAAILGTELSDNQGEDSVSYLSALRGEERADETRGGIVHHSDAGIFSIRSGKWKLILGKSGGTRRKNPKDKDQSGSIQLFDMETDAIESSDIQSQHPEVVERLKKLLAEYINKGRSTAGAPQQNDPIEKTWKQIDIINEYLQH